MKTAIIYIRVSSDGQVQGTSLATQEADCRAWCARQGYTVVEVFRDEGETAKTADRPGLIASVEYARKHHVDFWVCWKLDRAARDQKDGLTIRAELKRHGTTFASATESISDDPFGNLIAGFLFGIAQFDNEVRGVRAKRGMKETAMRGGWVVRAPIGFTLEHKPGCLPVLVPDARYSTVIAAAFNGLASGQLTVTGARQMLKSEGLTAQIASKVLRAPVYGGILRSALTDGLDVKAAFPGLVAPDAWRRAQAMQRAYKTRVTAGRGDFVLAGAATCEVCGGAIRGAYAAGKSGKRFGYYDCRKGHVRARMAQAHDDLRAIIAGECAPAVADLRGLVVREAAAKADFGRAECAAADRRRVAAEGRLSRIADGYADGVLDAATYSAKAAEYQGEIAAARLDAERSQYAVDKIVACLDQIVEAFSDPWALWTRLDLEGRKRLMAVFGVRLAIMLDGTCRTLDNKPVCNVLDGAETPGICNGTP